MAIAHVMTVGMSMSIASLYMALVQYYTTLGHKYPEARAAGSIGGAVNGGTIILSNGYYTRVK